MKNRMLDPNIEKHVFVFVERPVAMAIAMAVKSKVGSKQGAVTGFTESQVSAFALS